MTLAWRFCEATQEQLTELKENPPEYIPYAIAVVPWATRATDVVGIYHDTRDWSMVLRYDGREIENDAAMNPSGKFMDQIDELKQRAERWAANKADAIRAQTTFFEDNA